MNIGIIIGLIIQISNVLCVEIWYDNMESITDWSRTAGSSIVSTGCSVGSCLYFTPGFEMQRSTDVTQYENLYFLYYFNGYDILGAETCTSRYSINGGLTWTGGYTYTSASNGLRYTNETITIPSSGNNINDLRIRFQSNGAIGIVDSVGLYGDRSPTPQPTDRPTLSTDRPTFPPSETPTKKPTDSPTDKPTKQPTTTPTINPTNQPSVTPTKSPRTNPSISPTITIIVSITIFIIICVAILILVILRYYKNKAPKLDNTLHMEQNKDDTSVAVSAALDEIDEYKKSAGNIDSYIDKKTYISGVRIVSNSAVNINDKPISINEAYNEIEIYTKTGGNINDIIDVNGNENPGNEGQTVYF